MIDYYSCWSYTNNQAGFIDTRLILQINCFNLNRGDFRQKKSFNRNYNTPL